MLQAGRPRDWVLMRFILPAALWPRGSNQPLTEMSTRNLPGGKGWPVCRAVTLTAICEPTSHNPVSLHGLLQGQLYSKFKGTWNTPWKEDTLETKTNMRWYHTASKGISLGRCEITLQSSHSWKPSNHSDSEEITNLSYHSKFIIILTTALYWSYPESKFIIILTTALHWAK
jgi:hypothetical protein